MAEMKTANINCRIGATIKEQAEEILTKLGLPRSVAIDMFYRQIIINNGLPFSPTLNNKELVKEEMSKEEFNLMLLKGLKEANEKDSYDVDEVFEELSRGI